MTAVKVLVRGRARGPTLISRKPINFLGMVDKETGVIGDPSHDLHGKSLAGSVLVFPYGTGSSVGAYTIYSIKVHGSAPSAMICERADLTVATGCAIADIPLLVAPPGETARLDNGQLITVDADSATITCG